MQNSTPTYMQRICLQEKLEILNYENIKELLNKRSEIVYKCQYMNKFLLANYKSKIIDTAVHYH